MEIDVWGFHGFACGVDTWFPWMAYERPIDEVKSPLGKGE